MTRRPAIPPELTRGPFTLAEAQRAGVTRKQLRGTSWRRLGAGLYAWAGAATGPLLALAAVHRRLPAGAAFAGRTAAWLHGLDLPPADPIEVAVPAASGAWARSGASVRRASLDGDVVTRHGLPVTSPLRTVVDLATRLPRIDAVIAADLALHAGLVALAELETFAASHPGRPGIARLRRVIELAEPAAESAMESRLRLLLVDAGLPRPKAQVPIFDPAGRFLGRPDLYYPVQRLALEYDGGTHRDSLVQDDRRQNLLLGAGIRLLRFTAGDVLQTPDSAVALVGGALRGLSR